MRSDQRSRSTSALLRRPTVRNPTYFQRGDDLSDELKALKAKVAAADAYVRGGAPLVRVRLDTRAACWPRPDVGRGTDAVPRRTRSLLRQVHRGDT